MKPRKNRRPAAQTLLATLLGVISLVYLETGEGFGDRVLNAAESPHVRLPPPGADVISKLPKDGGPEFNRLVFEQSPYLLQHARNPVDWHPWGEEAFEKARKEGKPVFLSVGYSTCHWCHVMEHESFEDDEVAKLLNENFICVKVDREERPDIDNVYMSYTQALTGSGGWPMTVFMTADKKPFHAGTYFPKSSGFGRPGMMELIPRVGELWKTRKKDLLAGAEEASRALAQMAGGAPGDALTLDTMTNGFKQFQEAFDKERGGFSPSRKFPVPHNLMFLLRHWKRTGDAAALEMVEKTLGAMRAGGIWDHVGYGLHRYSTDPDWLAPHFEKMLYDQALLTIANVETYQATGKARYRETAKEILTYVLRDMTSKEGAFYSAEDADSEGHEGKFYIWKPVEIRKVLGEKEGDLFIKIFNITKEGNFLDEATKKRTGDNIPHLQKSLAALAKEQGVKEAELRQRLERSRQKLFAHREKRIHPYKDDKTLTDWNGLMIAALAKAGQALDEPKYTAAAKKAGDFMLSKLRRQDGRLHKRYRNGQAGLPAHLEDYAFATWGLIDLYEATFEVRYLQAAVELNDAMLKHFWDTKAGGLFLTADDGEKLLVRSKDIYDGAIPSGNSVAALNLVRLSRMTGNTDYEVKANELMKAFSGAIEKGPRNHPMLLLALDFAMGPSFEIVISGKAGAEDTEKMAGALRKPFLPNKVVLFRPDGDKPPAISKIAAYAKDLVSMDGAATAYVCKSFACQAPTKDPKVMLKSLEAKD